LDLIATSLPNDKRLTMVGCSAITWHPAPASVLLQCFRGEEHFSRVNLAFWHGACMRIKLTNMNAKILLIDDDVDVHATLASESVEGCLLRFNRMSRFFFTPLIIRFR
jgi:hypothetical protein